MQILRSALLASVAVVATAPAVGHAALNYTNVDVGVISTELNNTSYDGDGLLVRGSLAFHPNIFGFAQITDIGYDRNVDGLAWLLGVGGHTEIYKNWDIVGRVAFVRQKIDFGPASNNESGFMLTGSARGFVVNKLEIEGGVKHVHLADTGNDTSLFGEGRYYFTDRIAAGVLLQLGDTTEFGIHARFTF